MSSHVWVISTDLRRHQVKVTPNTFLSDVLQQACEKFGLSDDKYTLKHATKGPLDLSLPFRYSQLVSGAKLELVVKSKSPSVVTVAFQIPQPEAASIPGGRLICKVPSNLTVWKVLRQMESGEASLGKNFNFTARGVARMADGKTTGAGQLFYEKPVIQVMGRELAELADFQKTLAQLGLNAGNVLMRLSFRMTEKPLASAMEEISQFFHDQEEPAKTETQETRATKSQPQNEQNSQSSQPPSEALAQALDQTSGPEKFTASTVPTTSINTSPPLTSTQLVAIFSAPPPDRVPATVIEATRHANNEDDFVPSIIHAQNHQAMLQRASQNKRLLSDKELAEQAAAREAKLAAVTSVPIKVRFPDNTSAQWTLDANATGATLYQSIRDIMAHPTQPFKLVFPVERRAIADDAEGESLMRRYRLASNGVVVNLVWDDTVPKDVRTRPFLKDSSAALAKPLETPKIQWDDEDPSGGGGETSKTERIKDVTKNLSKKMPKWLKLPGKK